MRTRDMAWRPGKRRAKVRVVRDRAGSRNRYRVDPGPVYVNDEPERGRIPTLEAGATSGTFVMTYSSGMKAFFDNEGRMEFLEDAQGNRLVFSYCPDPNEVPESCSATPEKKALEGISRYAVDTTMPLTVAYVWQPTRIREQLRSQIGANDFTGRGVNRPVKSSASALFTIFCTATPQSGALGEGFQMFTLPQMAAINAFQE